MTQLNKIPTSRELAELAQTVGEKLLQSDMRIATAESCTGGGISYFLTEVAGSSQWFDRGFVTYANEAKQDMLGVTEATLKGYGAVSEQTVAQMAQGALDNSKAQFSVAVSGIAGPSGGSVEKPVGMVCFAWGRVGEDIKTKTEYFNGDRTEIRHQSIAIVLLGILATLNQ